MFNGFNGISRKEEQSFPSFINDRTLEELAFIRKKLGEKVHEFLFAKATQAKDKKDVPWLLLVNLTAAGKDSDAIVSNDGSSKYLAGAWVNYSIPFSANSLASKELVTSLLNFWQKNGLRELSIISGGYKEASGEQDGQFTSFVGTKDKILEECFKPKIKEEFGTKRYLQASQEISAIASLILILKFEGALISEVEVYVNEEIKAGPVAGHDGLLAKAYKIDKFNERIWEKMLPFIQILADTYPNQKISIGESFTSGLIASLFSSFNGYEQLLDLVVNWYSPKLKGYFGVPKSCLKDELIAEPETIGFATSGLLRNAPSSTGIAIGTTGWANYWVEGKPDFFSVGIASRKSSNEQAYTVSTIEIEISNSSNTPRSKGRRQLTRYLGVTAALYMLAKHLIDNYFDEAEFKEICQELLMKIQENATIMQDRSCKTY